ncbi:hypothetical protein BH23ACT10_BH23ACT10_00810 [soil metagenome]
MNSPRTGSAQGEPSATDRTEVRTNVYVATLVVAVAAIVLAVPPVVEVRDLVLWVPMIAAGCLTNVSLLPYGRLESSLGPIVIVAAAVIYPPSAVVVFVFLGFVHPRELRGEAVLVMSLFNRAMYGLSGAAAAGAAALVYAVAGGMTWQLVPATLFAIVSFEAVNDLLLAIVLVVRRGRSWRQALAESVNPFPRFAANAAVSAMLSLLIAILVRDVGRWSVLLVIIPVWLSYSAQRSAREAQDRAEQLAVRVRELEMLNALGGKLLSAHSADVIPRLVTAALNDAVDRGAVWLVLDGVVSAGDIRRVPIPGVDPAVLAVRNGDSVSQPVVEAVAGLVGLTLTRLQVEAELAETERARTALTARILEEATHERSRIAMDVHDDVLPLFAAAQMQIDNAEMLLEIDDREQAVEVIEQATSGVSDGIRSLRGTLEALRESTLVPGTAVDGVRKLMADLQVRTGIRSKIVAPDPMPGLPFAVELLAYETVRGCLANTEKHAHAEMVHVEFRTDDGKLVLLMQDDGRGFDPATIGERSHGLALMRQRAELARGSFAITGAPGAGTTVRLEVPTW